MKKKATSIRGAITGQIDSEVMMRTMDNFPRGVAGSIRNTSWQHSQSCCSYQWGLVLAAVTNPTDSLREPQPRISPLPEGFIENARELLEYVGEPVAFITSETRDIVMAYPPAERRYDYDVMQTNLKDEVDGDVEEDDNGNILLISVVVSFTQNVFLTRAQRYV